MKLLAAFFRLVRWPNLVFIGLAQTLFYVFILLPSFDTDAAQFSNKLTWPLFLTVSFSSVLIAAAGYVINDYFDVNIDRVNKPEKLVLDRLIRRRWAMFWHLGMSLTGILLGIWVGWKTGNFLLGPANLMCAVLLWIYSTSLKRKLLIGNLLISLLTAWVILVIWFAELKWGPVPEGFKNVQNRVYKLGVMYASFAFIISLVREVIKDMEDIKGDQKHGCLTMPIVWGMQATRLFVATWLVVLAGALLIVVVYALQRQWWMAGLYALVLILIPVLLAFQPLMNAQSPEQFHQLSSRIKWIMLSGILSMFFFYWYL